MNVLFTGVWFRVLVQRLRALANARRMDDEFEQELQAHVALLTDDYIRRGNCGSDKGTAR